MRFKIGDSVKLKEDIKGLSTIGISNETIEKLRGKIFTVSELERVEDGHMHDCIKFKDNVFSWSQKLFELATEPFRVITIYQKRNKTIATLTSDSTYVKHAKAICNPTDTYDFEIVASLAFGRLMDCEVVKVLEFEEPMVKKVKRKAIVGEYIEIVDPPFSFSKVGDILRVSIATSDWVTVMKDDHPREINGNTVEWNYTESDYVVLENYSPLEPQIKPSLSSFTQEELITELFNRIKN